MHLPQRAWQPEQLSPQCVPEMEDRAHVCRQIAHLKEYIYSRKARHFIVCSTCCCLAFQIIDKIKKGKIPRTILCYFHPRLWCCWVGGGWWESFGWCVSGSEHVAVFSFVIS